MFSSVPEIFSEFLLTFSAFSDILLIGTVAEPSVTPASKVRGAVPFSISSLLRCADTIFGILQLFGA